MVGCLRSVVGGLSLMGNSYVHFVGHMSSCGRSSAPKDVPGSQEQICQFVRHGIIQHGTTIMLVSEYRSSMFNRYNNTGCDNT